MDKIRQSRRFPPFFIPFFFFYEIKKKTTSVEKRCNEAPKLRNIRMDTVFRLHRRRFGRIKRRAFGRFSAYTINQRPWFLFYNFRFRWQYTRCFMYHFLFSITHTPNTGDFFDLFNHFVHEFCNTCCNRIIAIRTFTVAHCTVIVPRNGFFSSSVFTLKHLPIVSSITKPTLLAA